MRLISLLSQVVWERFEFRAAAEGKPPALEALGEQIKKILPESTDVKVYPVRGPQDEVIRNCLSLLVTEGRQILVEHPVEATFIDVEVISNFAEFLRVRKVVEGMGGRSARSRGFWIRMQIFKRVRQVGCLAMGLGGVAGCIYLTWLKGFWMGVLIVVIALILGGVLLSLFARALKNMK